MEDEEEEAEEGRRDVGQDLGEALAGAPVRRWLAAAKLSPTRFRVRVRARGGAGGARTHDRRIMSPLL